MTALGILWFVLIAVLIIGYFVLDGSDLGVGVLYPFIAKDERDRAVLRRSVGPVWDGNEVWLLTAGGALFAAFAPAYATTFSGFYLAIMLVLMGLILRAVSLEFRAHSDKPRLWDVFFFVGSLLPALLFGVAVGNVVAGIPLNANGDYTGTFFGLLTPFALACGVLGLVHMLAQGASWIALKSQVTDALHKRAAHFRRIFCLVELVVFVVVSVLYFTMVAPVNGGIGVPSLAILFVFLYAFSMLVASSFDAYIPSCDLTAHISICLGCVGLVGIMATSLFPNIVVASDPALSITVANAASSDVTLTAMTVIALIGVPLVLVYHFIVYRMFAGRIKDEELSY